MSTDYDEFETRLWERLRTIDEQIEQAKQQGRAAMADPTNRVGRQLAAQQIRLKEAEKLRVAAMLAGVQQQQSELLLSAFTSDYVTLMKTSSKAGPNLSEKAVEGVVNAYQSKLDGSHAVGTLLTDSAEDTLESTMDNSVNFLSASGSGVDSSDEAYAQLFNAGNPAAGGSAGPEPPLLAAAATVPEVAAPMSFPEVPSGAPGGHRRTTSFSGGADTGGIAWMLASDPDGTGS